MTLNALPLYDRSDNPTGCCPRFNADGWDAQVLTFRDLPMLRATTRSLLHVPLNMGSVFSRVLGRADAAGATLPERSGSSTRPARNAPRSMARTRLSVWSN